MPDAADITAARQAIAALLEPAAVEAVAELEHTPHQMDRLVQYSQAISLRRIADNTRRSTDLTDEIIAHVERVCGPLSTETTVTEGDDDLSILRHNIRAILL